MINEQFEKVTSADKNWLNLLGGLTTAFLAVIVSIFRWHLLVRALKLPVKLSDSLRIGFIGFLFQFLTLGVVGGDAVKAIFIAKQNPKEKAAAITTVFIDRVIGLFALFLITGIAYLCFLKAPEDPGTSWNTVVLACQISMVMVALGTLFFAAIYFSPKLLFSNLMMKIFRLPKIGDPIRKVCTSVTLYRKRFDVILTALVMSLGVHGLLTMSVFFVASGLSQTYPTLVSHFVIVPIAMVANALPLPGGLGGLELALDFLYVTFSKTTGGTSSIDSGFGLIVGFGYRLLTLIIAAIGVVYYLLYRREVRQLVSEAQAEEAKLEC